MDLEQRIKELEQQNRQLIGYIEYLAANIDKSITYTEYIAGETSKWVQHSVKWMQNTQDWIYEAEDTMGKETFNFRI